MQIMIKKLRLQRNILLGFMVINIATNSVLALKLYNVDTLTRLVPTIEQTQEISSSYVNDAALKARTEQIIYLLFSMKKENVDAVTSALLKQVDNAAYDTFKKKIDLLAEDIKAKNYRYIFTDIQAFEFDNLNFTVKVKGYLETYLAGKQLNNGIKIYQISFFNRGGVLTLKGFEEVSNEANN